MTFPDLELGIFLSSKLVFSLHERLRKGGRGSAQNFQIDPAYELAKFLYTGRCGAEESFKFAPP